MSFFNLFDEDYRGEDIKDYSSNGRVKKEKVKKTYFLNKHDYGKIYTVQSRPIKREIKDLFK